MTFETVFRVELVLQVHKGREEEFERAWLAVGRSVAEHPLNLEQWLARDLQQKGRYVIISDWPDEEAFRRFESEPSHLKLTGTLHALRESGSMSTLTVLHHLAGARSR